MTQKNPDNPYADEKRKAIHNALPSGSGIDNGCGLNIAASKRDKIVINSSFHVMDENGFYAEWIDFVVVVKPTFRGIDIDIKGKFSGNRNAYGLKDYLAQLFYDALFKDC